jgi:hypothetical protein
MIVLTHYALLCIVVGMTSVYVMHISNYTVVDMSISNANLYVVLVRSSSYFRVSQEGA